MKNYSKTKTKNNLWHARRRAGLGGKQVAFLLSQQSPDPLYKYEKGSYFPSLPIALKLETIYQTPIRLLFQDLFEQYKKEIFNLQDQNARLFATSPRFLKHPQQLMSEEGCFYAELLKGKFLRKAEIEAITKHIVALSNTLSDRKQGRDPFSSN